MKIAVVGAGIVGITTAYELALAGHEVSVFDKRQTAAEEASIANSGLVAPGWLVQQRPLVESWRALLPWSAGGPGLRWGHASHLKSWSWLSKSLRCAQQTGHTESLLQSHRLARFGQERLWSLTADLQLAYDHCQGALVLLRDEREMQQADAALTLMRSWGVDAKTLAPELARAIEPALCPQTPLHAALHLPGDEAANCRQFAMLIKSKAQALGCRFEFGVSVDGIDTSGGVYLKVRCVGANSGAGGTGVQRFDAVVVCTGIGTDALLRPLGLNVPLHAVYGQTISAIIREPLDAPVAAVVDNRHQISIVRMGQRVRISGGMRLRELTGTASKTELRRLYQVLTDWFPGAAQLGQLKGQVQEWQSAQAVVPDGKPLIGESGASGIWLNLGHATSGWAMACGGAKALADRLSGKEPEIDTAGFSPQRFLAS